MDVYNRAPLSFDRGKGAWLFTRGGDAYLDCVTGVATNALGHAHPRLVNALVGQAERLWHVSNAFRIPEQEALAQRLIAATFADVAFFCNSGTEAVECALKTARRYQAGTGAEHRTIVLGFKGSFHGRTHAALSAAGNQAYLDGLGLPLPGYGQLDIEDALSMAQAIASPSTAAVIIEPVQGEGGARAIPGLDLHRLRRLCSQHGVLLIYDEVQTGLGRTGQLFAYQWYEDAAPDILVTAKALGCGFPVGACLTTTTIGRHMTPGAHGSTFGGNPLAMAVALAAFDEISRPETLQHVRRISVALRHELARLAGDFPDIIEEVRGKGLLIGLKMRPPNRAFIAAARERHLLIASAGDNCVRLLPPLILTDDEVAQVIDRLSSTCHALRAQREHVA